MCGADIVPDRNLGAQAWRREKPAPAKELTDEDVRRIVREELAKRDARLYRHIMGIAQAIRGEP